jgi:hypothetical protein
MSNQSIQKKLEVNKKIRETTRAMSQKQTTMQKKRGGREHKLSLPKPMIKRRLD